MICASEYQKFVSLVGYTINFWPQTMVSRVDSDIWWRMPITMHELNEEQVLATLLNSGETRIQVFCYIIDILIDIIAEIKTYSSVRSLNEWTQSKFINMPMLGHNTSDDRDS